MSEKKKPNNKLLDPMIITTNPSNCNKTDQKNNKKKSKYSQIKITPKYKRFTPSPFIKEKKNLNKTVVITPMSNANANANDNSNNKKSKIQYNNNYAKFIASSRRQNSWDKQLIDTSSLNESNLFGKSILQRNTHIKNKESLMSIGASTISKASISYLNVTEIGNINRSIHNESIADTIISETIKQSPVKNNKNKLQKAKPISLRSNILINTCLQPKSIIKINKKENKIALKKQPNPSKLITSSSSSNKKNIEESNDKKKETSSTSLNSAITKEASAKINVNEGTDNKDKEKEKVIKRIRCMHDLSKTGIAGTDKTVNQDSFFIFKNFSNNIDYIYMGVCDGHGLCGHEVSGYIKENLPMDLNNAIKERKLNLLTDDLTNIINQLFIHENYNLRKHQLIDSKLSGTTCASVLYTPEKMLIVNLGDSRVVIGREAKGEWTHENLSRDHKPSERSEAERILKIGGRIRPMISEDGSFVGPLRVYMKEKDIPGLSMTRSFGDYYASTAGCISQPEITEYYFHQEDKFMIIATDGLWEFIESDEVIKTVKDYYLNDDIVGCCEYLYEESCRRWLEEEEAIDDITMIIVFFH